MASNKIFHHHNIVRYYYLRSFHPYQLLQLHLKYPILHEYLIEFQYIQKADLSYSKQHPNIHPSHFLYSIHLAILFQNAIERLHPDLPFRKP